MTRASNRLRLSIRTRVNGTSGDWGTARKRSSSTASSRCAEKTLAFELVIGTPERFGCGKQIASYVGVVPSEESSGDRRRLGHISKQGNSLLRFLLVEATQVTVRSNPDWRRHFHRVPDRKDYERAFDWKAQTISESEMRSSPSAGSCVPIAYLTEPTLLEMAILRQLWADELQSRAGML